MTAGDERYLLARDRGPERRAGPQHRRLPAHGRHLVLRRRAHRLVGSTGAMPVAGPGGCQHAVGVLAVARGRRQHPDLAAGSRSWSRERFPKTDQRLGSLYLYAIMRGLTFRRMRVPKPQVELGQK